MKQTINPLTWRFDIVWEDIISWNIKIVDQLPDVWETGIIYLMGNTIYIRNGTEFVQTWWEWEWNSIYYFYLENETSQTDLDNLWNWYNTRPNDVDKFEKSVFMIDYWQWSTQYPTYDATWRYYYKTQDSQHLYFFSEKYALTVHFEMQWWYTRIWVDSVTIEPVLPEIDENTKTFYLATDEDINTAQQIYNYLAEWKNPIIRYWDKNFLYCWLNTFQTLPETHIWYWNDHTHVTRDEIQLSVSLGTVTSIHVSYSNYINIIDTETNYPNTYNPVFSYNPATKGYVDTQLATKQWTLTPWTNITINNWVISASVEWALVYKGNVANISSLPVSWNIWDCYYVESELWMYARDWTQWNSIWWTSIDLSSYFDMDTNTTDNITEWTTNLFVTTSEKNGWNWKQDTIIAWTNITIDNDWKTINAVDTKYSAGTGIDITGTTIANTWVTSVNNQTWAVTTPKYSDFEFETATSWATLTISDFNTEFTPTQNFTIAAWTVKEWMQYIVRINNWATAYTMTLWIGITDPYDSDITLTANAVTTLVLLATDNSTLELTTVMTEWESLIWWDWYNTPVYYEKETTQTRVRKYTFSEAWKYKMCTNLTNSSGAGTRVKFEIYLNNSSTLIDQFTVETTWFPVQTWWTKMHVYELQANDQLRVTTDYN